MIVVDASALLEALLRTSEAKTHLPQILDEVERGETVRITRHGRPIARIIPEATRRHAEIDEAIANIRSLRRRTGKITRKELLSFRHEGHKCRHALRDRRLHRRLLGVRRRGPSRRDLRAGAYPHR